MINLRDEATLVYCEALREQRKQWFGGKRMRISSDEDGQDGDSDYGLGGSKKVCELQISQNSNLIVWFWF
jgi:hypothetical protein